MTVAVVIPVWDDYVHWLPEAVASVRHQRAAGEVIVVDNASAADVPAVEGATVVRAPERLTTGAARNLGLAAVTSPFVVFLDADDVMLPGSLAALSEGLVRHPGAVVFAMGIVDGTTGRRHRAPRRLARALARLPLAFAVGNAVWSLLPTQGATIFRTADVRAVAGYADRTHGEDWVLGAALAWRGRVRFDPRPALVYRWRWDSPGRARTGATPRADARAVRERLREMHLAPAWALAVVVLGQWLAITAVRPLFLAARRARQAAAARRIA